MDKNKRALNPIKRKNEKKTFVINGGNSITAANIKKDILESDLCSLYVKMGLTGKDIRIDDKGNEYEVGELEQPERMKIMKTLVDKVIPASKEEATDESSVDKWAMLGEKLYDITVPRKEDVGSKLEYTDAYK